MTLKQYVASKLPAIAKWAGVTLVSEPKQSILKDAKELVTQVELIYKEQSGEYKRHQVYSKLLKKYPEETKREIALAIEIAMTGM